MQTLRAAHVGRRMGLRLAAVGALFCVAGVLCAQSARSFAPAQQRPVQERMLPDRFPDKPSIAPSFSIPVEPLGFAGPGPLYLGARYIFASLDFLDENRLLFTFRVPVLLHRDAASDEERRIRAVVLDLPSGNIEAEALWTMHDHVRYLWMLRDGRFLVRDRDDLLQGDAGLSLKPFLHFPGPVLWLEMDPTQQYLVTNSFEPAPQTPQSGEVPSPATAAAHAETGGQQDSEAVPDHVLRILRRSTGQVLLVSRIRQTVHLPINSQGYAESLRGRGDEWLVNLNYFTGGSRILGSIDSTCAPSDEFASDRLLLIRECASVGGDRLQAVTTDGHILWADLVPPVDVWPQQIIAANGLRFARETLVSTHEVSAFAPLGSDDIRGQLVRVFDAATGDVVLETPASPILDVGGNFALSPSGRRAAVVNNGAIQVFDLPVPPPLPAASPRP